MVTLQEIWMPSPHYSTSRGPYNKVIFHTTEGAMKIRDLGAWFQNPSAGCSSHHGADNYERGVFGAYVLENHKAWTQGNANDWCLSLEQCAYTSWSRSTWLNDKGVLIDNSAQWLRYMIDKYSIPWTVLSDSQAQDPAARGICEHVYLGSWGSGHSDCGRSSFPLDVIIDKAKKWGGGGGTQPVPPAEEDEMFAVAIPPGPGDIGVSLPRTDYTAIGFCCDAARLGDAVVKVRVAWHRTDGSGWAITNVTLDKNHVKAVTYRPGDAKVDGVSFLRQDDPPVPITLFPNFG